MGNRLVFTTALLVATAFHWCPALSRGDVVSEGKPVATYIYKNQPEFDRVFNKARTLVGDYSGSALTDPGLQLDTQEHLNKILTNYGRKETFRVECASWTQAQGGSAPIYAVSPGVLTIESTLVVLATNRVEVTAQLTDTAGFGSEKANIDKTVLTQPVGRLKLEGHWRSDFDSYTSSSSTKMTLTLFPVSGDSFVLFKQGTHRSSSRRGRSFASDSMVYCIPAL